ncbi:MAG: flagellar basal body P-ring protein FlgI [Nitrospirae bacterium]|nr:flagellar basal body P-ring protein FlgI [Nitrospirota bacterium]MBF0533533.1 flagellar basal body P-ring protein FlgI [Nitrospirota bacterium]MBF0615943.1 flagellar basal body P-ring protein FlgI [Nitrospirota bacterium]
MTGLDILAKRCAKQAIAALLMAAISLLTASTVCAERVKDITTVKGIRENQLVGYGLVVGLNGSGDKKGPMLQSMVNMLYRMGVSIKSTDITAKNVAAVMVTAALPAFPKVGMKVDANVSAIGDAKSLQGGTLVMTPLQGPDNKVYALAQGSVSIGGFTAAQSGASVTKNFPTVGLITSGASVEKEFGFDLAHAEDITFNLKNSDFTTASNIRNAINGFLGGNYATTPDPSSVKVKIPPKYTNRVVELVNQLESLDANTDNRAKVIVNERTGTVIIGENVKLHPVAIAHGDLTIEVKFPSPQMEPGAVVQPAAAIDIKDKNVALTKITGSTLSEIVAALNKLGATPRDLIAILQSLKASGSLTADLEII